jgi:hypothetical protein
VRLIVSIPPCQFMTNNPRTVVLTLSHASQRMPGGKENCK